MRLSGDNAPLCLIDLHLDLTSFEATEKLTYIWSQSRLYAFDGLPQSVGNPSETGIDILNTRLAV